MPLFGCALWLACTSHWLNFLIMEACKKEAREIQKSGPVSACWCLREVGELGGLYFTLVHKGLVLLGWLFLVDSRPSQV